MKKIGLLLILLIMGLIFSCDLVNVGDNSSHLPLLKEKLEEKNISNIEESKSSCLQITINENAEDEEYIFFINSLSESELDDYIDNLYKDNQLVIKDIQFVNDPIPETRGTSTRICKVWCGIPAIGWGNINIRYNVTYYNNKFYGGNVIQSWKTGITVASWDHLFGSVKLTNQAKTAEVYATGVMTWGIPNTILSASSTETFLYFDTKPY